MAEGSEANEPISIHVVVESQLLVFQDISLGEYTHPNLVTHLPFCDVAVGVTAMVGETTNIAFLCRIDELVERTRTGLVRTSSDSGFAASDSRLIKDSYLPLPSAAS